MNINLIDRWLKDFKKDAEKWFEGVPFVNRRYHFFKEFIRKVNAGKEGDFLSDADFFESFDEMCGELHALSSQKLALARARGLKERHHTRAEYIKQFRELFDKAIPVDKRINKGIKGLKFIGNSSLSELVMYNEPEKYTILNQRHQQAIEVFEIKKDILSRIKKKGNFGAYYQAFNDIVREQLLDNYTRVIYNRSIAELTQQDLYSKTTLMLEIDQFFSWAFDVKKSEKVVLSDSKKEVTIRSATEGFIADIEINNLYSIKQPLNFGKDEEYEHDLKDKKFIFFLGENGTGKTNLLKAIALNLQKFSIDENTNREPVAKIDTILKENKDFSATINIYDTETQQTIPFIFNDGEHAFTLKNVYAYGTQRNTIAAGKNLEKENFLTLFYRDKTIANITEWLKDLDHKQLEVLAGRKDGYFSKKEFELILQDLLEIDNLSLEISSDEVNFIIHRKKYTFLQLSEGYQGVINLITDLIARLIRDNPNIKSLKELKATKAIVLIDELDMFLHPEWEKSICGKLHKKFPNIQFFVTTHSPILVAGAVKHIKSNRIKLFKLGIKDNETFIERDYDGTMIENWSLDLLTNSTLFDNSYLTTEDLAKQNTSQNEKELIERGNALQIAFEKEESEALLEEYLKSLNQ